VFYIGGVCIENVDNNWPRLGRVISNDGDDKRNITQRRCWSVQQCAILVW